MRSRSKIKTDAELRLRMVEGLRTAARRPNINGYVPHGKQEPFHRSPARKKLFIGGNRCLAEGTMVLMADGSEKSIEHVAVGDQVISAIGTKTRVTAVHNNGNRDVYCYTVGRYRDTVDVYCTEDHKFWAARESHGVLGEFSKKEIKSLVNARGRHKILRSQGTRFGYRESNAYMLGLMLGDGFMGDTAWNLQFTCADDALIEDFSHEFQPRTAPLQFYLKRKFELFEWFYQFGLIGTSSSTKFIPSEVWQWDEESISELCAGLLVTDGSFYSSKNNEFHVAYSSISYELIYEFRRLMGLRLGIWGSTITSDDRGNYQVTYGTQEALSRISRLPIKGVKAERTGFMYVKDSKASHVGVKSAEYVGCIPTYDITVAHPSNAYILANGFITSNSGKTVGGGTEAVFWMTGKHPYRPVPKPPTYGRIVSVDFKQGVEKIVKPEIARWLPPSEIMGGSWENGYDKELRTLYLANGSAVEFMSYDQDLEKFAGTSRHWIWFDEEPPEDIYTECLMRLIDTGGSHWITMTPVEGMTWTYDNLYEKANPNHPEYDPNILVIEVDSSMNPYLNPGEIEIILSGLDEDEKKARLRGQYVQRGGLIYPTFNEAIHVLNPIDPKEFNPAKWMHFAMMDSGINNPTAWLWAAVDREGRMVIYDEYYKSGSIVKQHAREVLIRNASHGVAPSYCVGDPSIRNKDPITGTSILIEYIDNGIPIILGNNDVTAGIDAVRRRFGGFNNPPTLFITANCVNLIHELKRYRWALWANRKMDREKNQKEEPNKKDDHACDALRYGVASRPISEDFSIPEEPIKWAGVGASVSPYHGRTDPGTTIPTRAMVDDILGSEW